MQTSIKGFFVIVLCFLVIFVSYKYYQQKRSLPIVETPQISQVARPSLTDNSWLWTHTAQASGTIVQAPNQKFLLTFIQEGNRVTSTTDCNTLSSTFIQNNEMLSFKPFAMTKMACKDAHDGEYAQALVLTTSFTIREDTLFINLNKDLGTMVFKKVASSTTTTQ